MATIAIQKGLVDTYSVSTVLFYRYVVAVMIGLPLFYYAPMPSMIDLGRIAIVALLILATMTTIVTSVKYLPLGRTTILLKTGPIIVLVLAPLLLGEKTAWWQWAAVALGLAGTILVMNDRGHASVYDLWPVAAAFAYAATLLGLRWLSSVPSALTRVLWLNLITLLMLFPYSGWIAPRTEDLLLIVAAGVTTWLCWWLTFVGLSRITASSASAYEYASIVFALAIGYVVWSEIPTGLSIIGSAIIIGGGLFAACREGKEQ